MKKLPGQESKPCHSTDSSHRGENAGSSTARELQVQFFHAHMHVYKIIVQIWGGVFDQKRAVLSSLQLSRTGSLQTFLDLQEHKMLQKPINM